MTFRRAVFGCPINGFMGVSVLGPDDQPENWKIALSAIATIRYICGVSITLTTHDGDTFVMLGTEQGDDVLANAWWSLDRSWRMQLGRTPSA